MKRSPLKKYSQKEIPKLKRKLWPLFARWIKQRDKNICFTCGKKVESYASQAGHFIPKSVCGSSLYHSPLNVFCQCSFCNLQLEGNRLEFAKRLGEKRVKELYRIKDMTIEKWDANVLIKMIDYYQNKLKNPFNL